MPYAHGRGNRHRATFVTGRPARKPQQRKRPEKPNPVIPDDLRAQFAAEREEALRRRPPVDARTMPVTGRCHDCGKPVPGERRLCGRCAARRSDGR